MSTCVNSLKNKKKKKNPGPSDSVIPLLRTFPKEMIRNTVLHSSKHPEVGNWNVLNSFFPAEPVGQIIDLTEPQRPFYITGASTHRVGLPED